MHADRAGALSSCQFYRCSTARHPDKGHKLRALSDASLDIVVLPSCETAHGATCGKTARSSILISSLLSPTESREIVLSDFGRLRKKSKKKTVKHSPPHLYNHVF